MLVPVHGRCPPPQSASVLELGCGESGDTWQSHVAVMLRIDLSIHALHFYAGGSLTGDEGK